MLRPLASHPLILALVVASAAALPSHAEAADGLADYLLDDENYEIALARSAAPAHISDDASVWVLRAHGYVRVAEGANGFNCLVVRSWAGPRASHDPRVLAPQCINPNASESVLEMILYVARNVGESRSLEDIDRGLTAEVDAGRIRTPGPGSFVFMMSGAQWLNPRVSQFLPHLMFYNPGVSNEMTGSQRFAPGLPFVFAEVNGGNFNDMTVTLPADRFVYPRTLDRGALEDPARPAADREQDEVRRPLEVYEFGGIRPGLDIVDLFAGTGYNTHLLSRVVGEGHVYAVDGFLEPAASRMLGSSMANTVDARIHDVGLDNVAHVKTIEDVPDASADVVVTVRNFHDIEFFDGDRAHIVAQIDRVLRPGGSVVVVDVAANQPGFDQKAHRLHESDVIAAFDAGGFLLASRSDMLANPDDDRTQNGFDSGRYKLDQYVLKFTRR